ncbi:MAG: HTH-type transcriptional repressor YvoA [Actinobacteria bacterium ADurb.Bin346]|nr:MAG: HTH-type transcriptional repressor YvoA [Actinobacteria bacterium ADurb.Bin346]
MIEASKINRNLKVPYYYQLYESIIENIENNILVEGDKLAAEMELCEQYGVSRITVRQALKELELNGFIVRERGRGTFVRRKIETHSLQKVSSIVDELRREGIKTENKILVNKAVIPEERVKKILNLNSGEQILFVKRLIFAYGGPLYITKAYLPYRITGKISTRVLRENSFTNIITDIPALKLIHSKRILEPAVPDAEILELLCLRGSAKKVIHYLQTIWTARYAQETVTLYFEEYFNPTKGKFVFEKNYE